MHVVPVERACLLEERVVERVLRPGEVAKQVAPPTDEDLARQAFRQSPAGPAHPRVDAAREVASEPPDGLGAQNRRRHGVLPARPRQAEDALRVVVPLRVVGRRRLHERAPVDDQILVPGRAHADDVGVERQVEARGDAVGDRQLDQLLDEPAVHRRPDQPQLRAQPRGRPEVVELGNDVGVAHDDVSASRHLPPHGRHVVVGSDDVAGAERLEEGLE